MQESHLLLQRTCCKEHTTIPLGSAPICLDLRECTFKDDGSKPEPCLMCQAPAIGHGNPIIAKRRDLLNSLSLVYDGGRQAPPGSSESFQKIPTDGKSKQMADAPYIIGVSHGG
jgi:hypothetical protein